MLLATGLAGVCFAMVHAPASRMSGRGEWEVFVALLDLLYLLGIPAAGLQAVFAQLGAGAVTEARREEVRGAARRVLAGLTLVWLVYAAGVWWTRERWTAGLRIPDPAALWLTLLVGLTMLWMPVFAGLLQGGQRFFWLGSMIMAGAAGRLVAIWVTVVWMGGGAVGGVVGVLIGTSLGLGIAVWASRGEWMGRAGRFDWGPWLGRTLCLTLGMAPIAVMMAGDTLLVQAEFDEDGKNLVLAAGRIAKGMVSLTAPMAMVLFPRIARSAATGEPTDVLKLALGATLGVGIAVGLGCTAVPSLPLQVLFAGNPQFADAARYVPWAVWCMVPLTAATTLIHYQLAAARFAAVPWLLAVAGGYAWTLMGMREGMASKPVYEAFRQLILVLGAFNLLLLAVAVLFSWRRPRRGGAEGTEGRPA